MSDEDKKRPRPLKAKRFNKFESSSRTETTCSRLPQNIENPARQGIKRSYPTEESINDFKNKKGKCEFNVSSPSPTSKNLANRRLQILREKIQSPTRANSHHPKIEFPATHASITSPNTSFMKSPFSESPKPKINPSKNLANERLQKVRRSINATPDDLKKTPEQIKFEKEQQKKSGPNDRLQKIKENFHAAATKIQENCNTQSSKYQEKAKDEQTTFQDKTVRGNVDNSSFVSNSTNPLKRSTSCLSIVEEPTKKLAIHNSPLLKATKVDKPKKYPQKKGVSPYSITDRLKVNQEKPKMGDRDKTPITKNKVSEGLCLPSNDTFLDKMTWTSRWLANTQAVDSSSVFSSISTNNSNNIYKDAVTELQDTSLPDDEEMEWTNAEPEETVTPLDSSLNHPENKTTGVSPVKENLEESKPGKSKDVCLVVDTNVLISHLEKIEEIINMKVESTFKPIVYVPWMVVNELDYIKDNYHDKKMLKNNAFKAIKCINTYLSQEHPQLKGQSIYDVEQQKLIGTSPDDKIVSCTLQALEKYETVILVSNDVNIRNKALINNLAVCSADEVRMKIMMKLRSSIKSQKILKKMELFCSSMISHFARDAFGNMWTKMDMLKGPPWPVSECLKRFKKYWFTLFKDKLLKHFQGNLDELQKLLDNDNCFCDNTPDYEKFKKKCIEICIHFKDVEEVRGLAQNAIDEIKKL